MKKLLLALAVASASSCAGGQAPELYAVIIDFFRPSTSCYNSGMFPATSTTAASPAAIRVEVYDWADQGGSTQKVFLEIVDGSVSVDMGDAPNVTLGGFFEGSRGSSADQPITFAANRTLETTTTVLGSTTTITDTTSATIAFPRGQNFKGTMELKSSRACAGSCGNPTPSCTISNINIRGSRLKVEYEQAP